MELSYINDEFFSRLESLSFNLKSYLSGYFGGKHLVKTFGQTVEFADFRDYQLVMILEESTGIYIVVLKNSSSGFLLTKDK